MVQICYVVSKFNLQTGFCDISFTLFSLNFCVKIIHISVQRDNVAYVLYKTIFKKLHMATLIWGFFGLFIITILRKSIRLFYFSFLFFIFMARFDCRL